MSDIAQTTEASKTSQTHPPEDKGEKIIAEMSPEELELNRKRFLFKQGFSNENPDANAEKKETEEAKPSEDEEKKKAEEKRVEDEKAKTAAARAAKVRPKERAKPVEAKPLTSEDVRAAAEAGARAVIESSKPKEQAEVHAEVELSSKDKTTIEVLKILEANDPSAKGIVDKTLKFWKDEQRYIAEWERDNPGKKFNAKDDSHAEFFEANEPQFDEEEFDRAKSELAAAPANRKAEEATKIAHEARAKSEAIEFERNLEKAVPAISKTVHDSIVGIIEEATPQLADILGKSGSRVADDATLKKIEEEDPVAFEIITRESEKAKILVSELEMLSRFPSHYKPNVNKTIVLADDTEMAPHRELIKLINELEQDLKALPHDETDRGSKSFIPQSELQDKESEIIGDASLTQQQKNSKVQALRSQFWTLSQKEIRDGIVAEAAAKVKSRVEHQDRLFNLRASKNGKAAGKSPPAKTENGNAENQVPGLRKSAPAIATSSDKLNTSVSGSAGAMAGAEIAVSKTFPG